MSYAIVILLVVIVCGLIGIERRVRNAVQLLTEIRDSLKR